MGKEVEHGQDKIELRDSVQQSRQVSARMKMVENDPECQL